jgi:hypothetical protein
MLALVVLLALPSLLLSQAIAQEEEPPLSPPQEVASSVLEYIRAAYRDPFRSLREPKIEDDKPRPEGPPGMLIEEIDVVGVLAGPKGAMVLILGSDGLGYSLTEGAPLYDGVTLRINPDEGLVVFRQDVNDPNRIKPYRDIERRLDSGS